MVKNRLNTKGYIEIKRRISNLVFSTEIYSENEKRKSFFCVL